LGFGGVELVGLDICVESTDLAGFVDTCVPATREIVQCLKLLIESTDIGFEVAPPLLSLVLGLSQLGLFSHTCHITDMIGSEMMGV
jgi:hypothetical protein